MTIDAIVERVSEGVNLLENLNLIDPKTWQTSQEVFRDWNNGASVIGVNTANLSVYRLVDGEAVLNLLSREGNPFCDERFQKEAYNGIIYNEFFSPQGAMKQHIQAAIQPAATVHYSKLRVKTKDCNPGYGYVEVDSENNQEEKKLFNGVYGTKNPGNGKRVYLLRENVVKAQLRGNNDDLVVRACYFGDNQDFAAVDRSIDIYDSAVRGVRRRETVAEGDAKNVPCAPQVIDSVRSAYNALGAVSPEEAARKLQPADAANMAAVLAAYYTKLQINQ